MGGYTKLLPLTNNSRREHPKKLNLAWFTPLISFTRSHGLPNSSLANLKFDLKISA